MIHQPHANDFIKGVRYHDVKDAKEASAMFAEAKLKYRKELAQIADRHGQSEAARVGMRRGGTRRTRMGSQGTGNPGVCTPSPSDDMLGFNTLPTAGFPVTGGGVGVITATPGIVVTSGRACSFCPNALFFEGRDAANALAVVAPTLLTSAIISGQEQLIDSTNTGGITSAVFGLTNSPLPISWESFTNTGQQSLTMIYANTQAAAVTLEVFGIFWGEGQSTSVCRS